MKSITLLALGAIIAGSSFTTTAAKEKPEQATTQQRRNDANVIGHVVDRKTGEHLPYVTVTVKGTTLATLTDATGHYFFKDLPTGHHHIEAKYVGYRNRNSEK